MSQEKVDRYKKEKANRKKTNARNKVKRAAARVVTVVVLAVNINAEEVEAEGIYTGYKYYENSRPVECYKADLTAVNDYINGLKSTEATESDAK